MIAHSELHCITWKGVLFNPLCRLLIPILLLKYRGFWGLRCAALNCRILLVRKIMKRCYNLYCSSHSASVPLGVRFDGPPCLPHGLNGIFIGELTHIGRNVTILQQVTIGEDTFSPLHENARRRIGDNVFIGAGAKIIGGVIIGNRCRIGANCCVYKDLPDDSVAVMAPTRVIQKTNLDNSFRRGDRVFRDGRWVND